MTEDLDELVSAYVDGALTPAERARVDGNPELVERVQEFRSVQQLLRTTPALPHELREQMITTALDASETASIITSLATRTRRTRYALVGAAAAAVIALGGIIALNNDSEDSDLAAVTADADEEEIATTDDAAADSAFEAAPADADALDDVGSLDGDAAADSAETDFDADSADDAMEDEEAALDEQTNEQLELIGFTDRADLEAALTSNPSSIGVVTMNALGAFDPNAAATIFACTDALTPDLNGAIDGVARAVITDTSAYLGVPADTEVLIVVAGDSYVVADITNCEVFATETLFS